LSGAVGGQEFDDDVAEVERLRSRGEAQTSANLAFNVLDVALDAPNHAVVHTREIWSAELHDAAGGQLIQRIPATTYAETYTVEYQNGTWIVTLNKLRQS
jgi:hypothetical protein